MRHFSVFTSGQLSLRRLSQEVPEDGCMLLFNATRGERNQFAKNSNITIHVITNHGVRTPDHVPRDYYITRFNYGGK